MKENQQKNWVGHFLGVLACIVAIVLSMIGHKVSSTFRDLFLSFGEELPLLSKLFVSNSFAYYALPILCLLAYLCYLFQLGFFKKAILVSWLLIIFMSITFIAAMYIPVFTLGDKV